MSADFYLDKFEDVGLGKLAHEVRTSLPSRAKQLLRDALSENDRAYQEAILTPIEARPDTRVYQRREDLLKGALREIARP